jgi:NTE family protein
MLGGALENTTSSDFRVSVSARYLAFDPVGSGSEFRIDGTIGSDASLAAELYRPIGSTPLFVAPYALVTTTTFNLIEDDTVVARYRQNIPRVGLNAGVNIGPYSDLRPCVTCEQVASIKRDPASELSGGRPGGLVGAGYAGQPGGSVPWS